MKVRKNSLFPVPSQQSSGLQRLWACSCHVPGPPLMKESFVLLISDTLCTAQVPRTKSVGRTMSLSAVGFKKMKHKSKTRFTWDVFLSVKLASPILKENVILSVFKSLLYSLLLLSNSLLHPPTLTIQLWD